MWTASTGLANGTFYWDYFLFEVPSNVVMEKVGARLWIARIMITRGLLAGATALVTGSSSYGVVRFLLGVAEAGFFPGSAPGIIRLSGERETFDHEAGDRIGRHCGLPPAAPGERPGGVRVAEYRFAAAEEPADLGHGAGVGRGAAERRQIGDDHVARLHHCDIRAENRKPKVGLRHCREVRDGVVERRLSGDTVACAYLDLL